MDVTGYQVVDCIKRNQAEPGNRDDGIEEDAISPRPAQPR